MIEKKAIEFKVKRWVGNNGEEIKPIRLENLKGKFKVIFCFQSWCPTCHSREFPNLQKLVKEFENNDKIVFLAIQTVFEGYEYNTYKDMLLQKKKYNLNIPFGQDEGDSESKYSCFRRNFGTGGTPWFVFIDEENNIIEDENLFADFVLNFDNTVNFLKKK